MGWADPRREAIESRRTYLVGHDDESDVGSAAFVESHRIGYVETHLSVPFSDFGEIFPLEFEQVQRDIGTPAFLEADGTRQSDKFHLLVGVYVTVGMAK